MSILKKYFLNIFINSNIYQGIKPKIKKFKYV